MKPRLKSMQYAFELEDEQAEAVRAVARCADFPPPSSLAGRVSWILGAEMAPAGNEFTVSLTPGGGMFAEKAAGVVRSYAELALAYVIYVAGTDPDSQEDEARGKSAMHAGDGFVLCNATAPDGSDLGVTLHFLDDGRKATKWFDGPAAGQFRQLSERMDRDGIRRIVAKHVDLDPAPSRAPGA